MQAKTKEEMEMRKQEGKEEAVGIGVEILPSPIQGRADWRNYRAFRLSNGVVGLAVEDKESKTTGMACLVNVGASADPRELSGLAHFCEHMCFLGSEKYPGENEYKRFLSSHGGRSNASTSMQCTNYKAEVLADHAEQAFDIFSNFFVAPLFTLSGTSREVNAIDSENSKNLISDDRRRLQILKALADPTHWYSKFSTGHAQTLDTTSTEERLIYVREALLAFHRKHYQPTNMTVVLAGPQSLDTLQKWIVDRYSKIPNNTHQKEEEEEKKEMSEIELRIEQAAAEAPPNSLNEPPPPFRSAFTPQQQGGRWPVLLTTKPLKSMRKVVLLWPIPSNDNRMPDQSASSMLSHLLGHEGEGSSFAILQDHGLLNSLSAGPRTRAPDFTLFQVDLGLTEKGERHWQLVVDVIFEYCRLLKTTLEQNPQELARIWGEMSRLDQLFFHQTSPGNVYAYAPNLADRILSYGTEKALSAGQMLEETEESFPLEKVKEVVNLLIPSNCIVERCSEMAWEEAMAMTISEDKRDAFGTKKEPWYGIDYHLSEIENPEVLASWNGSTKSMMENEMKGSRLSLPRPNRYIPRTLDLCPDLPEEAKQGTRLEKSIDPPTLLVDDIHGRLFHRLDDRYALPKSSLTFLIRNAAVQNVKTTKSYWEHDDKTALLSSMISGVFGDAMAQETYDADLAGLHWSLSMTSAGIKLRVDGFSDRLPDLGTAVLKEFLSGHFLQPRYFDAAKDRVIRSLRTYFEARRADSHAVYYRDALMASKDQGIDESLALAQQVDLDDLQNQFKTILSNSEISFECLFTGNVSEKEARDFYVSATTDILQSTKPKNSEEEVEKPMIPSGMVERRVNPGEDIELHFASKNPSEENGAVVCSYQSSIPSYKGDGISHPDGLGSSAAIRLISHMIREPLFDDLRTKQQLGYVVTAYYEMGLSSRPNEEIDSLGPLIVPVDFITVVILSRKLAPPDIVKRIDEFMVSFRESLINMPESEIRDHANALSTKLLQPIQKLHTEASNHFEKIQRYGPEIFHNLQKHGNHGQYSADQLPWNSVQSLAGALGKLTRQDLLETWDRMTQPTTRCRIISCVYGKTFPLHLSRMDDRPKPSRLLLGWGARSPVIRVVNNFPDLLQLRTKFRPFDDRVSQPTAHRALFKVGTFLGDVHSQPLLLWSKIGVGAILGAAGIIGLSFALRSHSQQALRPPPVATRRNS